MVKSPGSSGTEEGQLQLQESRWQNGVLWAESVLQPILLSLLFVTIFYWSNFSTRASVLGIYCCITKDHNLAGLMPTYYFILSVGQDPARLRSVLPRAAVSCDTPVPVPSSCGCWQDSPSCSYRSHLRSLLSTKPAGDPLFLELTHLGKTCLMILGLPRIIYILTNSHWVNYACGNPFLMAI